MAPTPTLFVVFIFLWAEPSMEMAAVFRDLPPQFVAGFCAVDLQFLGQQPVNWLEHWSNIGCQKGDRPGSPRWTTEICSR